MLAVRLFFLVELRLGCLLSIGTASELAGAAPTGISFTLLRCLSRLLHRWQWRRSSPVPLPSVLRCPELTSASRAARRRLGRMVDDLHAHRGRSCRPRDAGQSAQSHVTDEFPFPPPASAFGTSWNARGAAGAAPPAGLSAAAGAPAPVQPSQRCWLRCRRRRRCIGIQRTVEVSQNLFVDLRRQRRLGIG